MSDKRRRALLKTAAAGLASVLVAGCSSTEFGRPGTDRTDESETDPAESTSTENASTGTASTENASTENAPPQPVGDDYGPWSVVVVNDLEAEHTVTVRILAPDGDVHDETAVTVAGGDGTEAVTVTESGIYTLEVSTGFDTATVEFNACKLNRDVVVELIDDDGERRLNINQLHSDPAARATIDDPYTCE